MAVIIEAIKNSGTCDILRNVSRLLSTQVLTLLVALAGRSSEKGVQQHSNTAAERCLKVLYLEKSCGQVYSALWSDARSLLGLGLTPFVG